MNGSINWIKKYVEDTNSKGIVVGNSGGKDSATVIAMAVKALGKDNVITVAMPCNSAKSDEKDAELVAKRFDVEIIKLDLSDSFNQFKKEINISLGERDLSKEALINIKPRLRMSALYAIAQTLGYLVIGTGNLCERMVRIYNKMGRQWIWLQSNCKLYSRGSFRNAEKC